MVKNLRILSHNSDAFLNRRQAGKFLSQELKYLSGKNVCILGIPRGGIIIASEIAKDLKIDYDIILTRKIGAPFDPEFAIGAISEDGAVFLNEEASQQINARDKYIQQEKSNQLLEIKRRAEIYRKIKPKISLKNKIAVLTDDGVATGATMSAAVWAARQEAPSSVIVALPVGPQDSLLKLAKDADQVICLRVPFFFAAVGQFYKDFPQVSDNEVIELLKSRH
jgi:predicted phosphoribosyltransferase